MKNNKGITLIALVITIIVLLILAGITIAMLTGDNGLLTNANKAKAKDIEATVDEQVRMGIAAIRLEIAKEAASDPSYNAKKADNATALASALQTDLEKTSGKSDWTVTATTTGSPTTASLQIKYAGQDYKNAKNGNDWVIKYAVRLEQQGVVLSSQVTAENTDAVTVPNS